MKCLVHYKIKSKSGKTSSDHNAYMDFIFGNEELAEEGIADFKADMNEKHGVEPSRIVIASITPMSM